MCPFLYRDKLDFRLTNIVFVFVRIQIEELYSNLTKKNGEIYVHRGKALREKVQKRTRLLSFNLASTEFLIFSDVSMTGKETILDFIKVQIHKDKTNCLAQLKYRWDLTNRLVRFDSWAPVRCSDYRDKICVYDEHPIAGQNIQHHCSVV